MCCIIRRMITKTRLFFMTMIAAFLTFGIAIVTTNTFLTQSAFAQKNPIPSLNSQAYYHACVYQQPRGTHAACCYPP
jgi:hypothetical protein